MGKFLNDLYLYMKMICIVQIKITLVKCNALAEVMSHILLIIKVLNLIMEYITGIRTILASICYTLGFPNQS